MHAYLHDMYENNQAHSRTSAGFYFKSQKQGVELANKLL